MDSFDAKLAAAQRQVQSGQAEQALASLQRLLPKHPDHPALAGITAHALITLGRPGQALYYARRAAELAPPNGKARALSNLGLILAHTRDKESRDEALSCFERALALDPRSADARIGVVNILMERQQWARAEAICREHEKFGPHDQLILTHAAALVSLGRLRDSMNLLAAGTKSFPDHPRIRSGLASTAIYLSEAHPAEIARLFRDYGRILEKLTPRLSPAPPRALPRPLRVGILSPDLRMHSVAFFIQPFFEHHDKARIALYAYMTGPTEDGVSERLKAHSAGWRSCASMKDDALVQHIREDKIDVLLDLAGHTLGHRLSALARKPAPIQATYLGFPDTTGLSTVDYRIVDSLTDPPGPVPPIDGDPQPTFDERATEKLIRLDPCFICYRPRESAPHPARAPRAPGAGPVFASFNAARKISTDCIALWSRILREVDRSTLILKAVEFADPEGSRTIAAAFERAGIEPARVQFMPPQDSLDDHLAMYGQVDVALDTYPYHGTTTTCETLWMGVPVVTLAGDRHAARVGVSLLTAVGAADWIAHTPDQYVTKAAALARDQAALDHHRATLRARLAASPVCRAPEFAHRLTTALERMAGL